LLIRHRVGAVFLVLALLAIAGGAIAWVLATRTHHEAPKLSVAPPQARLVQVRPCLSCAHDYNPDAISGPKTQNPNQVGYAIDASTSTAWQTEHYYNGSLQKDGVGLYVDMGKPVTVRDLVLYTQTPGYRAQIWASSSPPDPEVFRSGPGGWTRLADIPKYRYYLVWIKTLPPGRMLAAINEIALYKLTR
jgi:hypothetical protein